MQINDGKHEDVSPVESIEDTVGKSARDSSALLSVDYLVLQRVLTNAIKESIDLVHERPTETSALSLIR